MADFAALLLTVVIVGFILIILLLGAFVIIITVFAVCAFIWGIILGIISKDSPE